MKRSGLTASIAMTLALSVTAMPDARAMHLDRNGLGQVLIFPYYTANSGNQTLISVVNQTSRGKAIKVRFREARNGREVLDFNLYLSPHDVWTASIFLIGPAEESRPANLTTDDNSCTAPAIKRNSNLPQLPNGSRYAPFSNYQYSGASDDAGPNTLDRTREGYFELIEMGEVVNTSHDSLWAITHGSNGIPADCRQIELAWHPPGSPLNYWTVDPLRDMLPPGGGLMGTASIINVRDGTLITYNAEAIADFSDIVQHTNPTMEQPSLASGHDANTPGTVTANVFHNGTMVASRYPAERAIDAVSALLSQQELLGEFATSAATGADSEWVVTLPTKYAYVDQAIVGNSAIAPFPSIFPTTESVGNTGIARVVIDEVYFNQERRRPPPCLDPQGECFPFGPMPGIVPPPIELHWSSNVISLNQAQAQTKGSHIFGSALVKDVDANDYNIQEGWMRLGLNFPLRYNSSFQYYRMRADLDGGIWRGLPAVGFSAMTFNSGQNSFGLLSSYGETSRLIRSNDYQAPVVEAPIFRDQFE